MRAWLDARAAEGRFDAIGIATFGPVDLDKSSPPTATSPTPQSPGGPTSTSSDPRRRILIVAGFDTTARPRCRNSRRCVRMAIDDDQGEESAIQNLCYVTVGTGVGVGGCRRRRVRARAEPSGGGHIRVARLPRDGMPGEPGAFEGGCPYHADCVEGMANAVIARRCGAVGELSEVPDDHEAWDGRRLPGDCARRGRPRARSGSCSGRVPWKTLVTCARAAQAVLIRRARPRLV